MGSLRNFGAAALLGIGLSACGGEVSPKQEEDPKSIPAFRGSIGEPIKRANEILDSLPADGSAPDDAALKEACIHAKTLQDTALRFLTETDWEPHPTDSDDVVYLVLTPDGIVPADEVGDILSATLVPSDALPISGQPIQGLQSKIHDGDEGNDFNVSSSHFNDYLDPTLDVDTVFSPTANVNNGANGLYQGISIDTPEGSVRVEIGYGQTDTADSEPLVSLASETKGISMRCSNITNADLGASAKSHAGFVKDSIEEFPR